MVKATAVLYREQKRAEEERLVAKWQAEQSRKADEARAHAAKVRLVSLRLLQQRREASASAAAERAALQEEEARKLLARQAEQRERYLESMRKRQVRGSAVLMLQKATRGLIARRRLHILRQSVQHGKDAVYVQRIARGRIVRLAWLPRIADFRRKLAAKIERRERMRLAKQRLHFAPQLAQVVDDQTGVDDGDSEDGQRTRSSPASEEGAATGKADGADAAKSRAARARREHDVLHRKLLAAGAGIDADDNDDDDGESARARGGSAPDTDGANENARKDALVGEEKAHATRTIARLKLPGTAGRSAARDDAERGRVGRSVAGPRDRDRLIKPSAQQLALRESNRTAVLPASARPAPGGHAARGAGSRPGRHVQGGAQRIAAGGGDEVSAFLLGDHVPPAATSSALAAGTSASDTDGNGAEASSGQREAARAPRADGTAAAQAGEPTRAVVSHAARAAEHTAPESMPALHEARAPGKPRSVQQRSSASAPPAAPPATGVSIAATTALGDGSPTSARVPGATQRRQAAQLGAPDPLVRRQSAAAKPTADIVPPSERTSRRGSGVNTPLTGSTHAPKQPHAPSAGTSAKRAERSGKIEASPGHGNVEREGKDRSEGGRASGSAVAEPQNGRVREKSAAGEAAAAEAAAAEAAAAQAAAAAAEAAATADKSEHAHEDEEGDSEGEGDDAGQGEAKGEDEAEFEAKAEADGEDADEDEREEEEEEEGDSEDADQGEAEAEEEAEDEARGEAEGEGEGESESEHNSEGDGEHNSEGEGEHNSEGEGEGEGEGEDGASFLYTARSGLVRPV